MPRIAASSLHHQLCYVGVRLYLQFLHDFLHTGVLVALKNTELTIEATFTKSPVEQPKKSLSTMPSAAFANVSLPSLLLERASVSATAVCPREARPRAAEQGCPVTKKAVAHARLLSDVASRETLGSAFNHPVPAGINCVCDVGQAVLKTIPQHDHEVWYALSIKSLHLISVVLTASPS